MTATATPTRTRHEAQPAPNAGTVAWHVVSGQVTADTMRSWAWGQAGACNREAAHAANRQERDYWSDQANGWARVAEVCGSAEAE